MCEECLRLRATNNRLRSFLRDISLMKEYLDGRRNKGKIRKAAELARQALEENRK